MERDKLKKFSLNIIKIMSYSLEMLPIPILSSVLKDSIDNHIDKILETMPNEVPSINDVLHEYPVDVRETIQEIIADNNFEAISNAGTFTPQNVAKKYISNWDGDIEWHSETYLLPALEKYLQELNYWAIDNRDLILQFWIKTSNQLNTLEKKNRAIELELEKFGQRIKELEVKYNSLSLVELRNGKFIDTENEIQYFRNRYYEPLFLHRNVEKKVHLNQVYQVPTYSRASGDWCNKLPDVSTTDLLKACIMCDDNDPYHRMLVVLGHPGGGKSSLISYLFGEKIFLNEMYEKKKQPYVFRFSSLESIDWEQHSSEKILSDILKMLDLKKKSQLSNKLLVLDGFDEIYLPENQRTNFLNTIYANWCKNTNIHNFSIIITCRENYFDTRDCKFSSIILNPMNSKDIRFYANKYWKAIDNIPPQKEKIIQGLTHETMSKVMGIPILLYLTLALNVTVNENTTEESVYKEVFSKDSKHSIYKRPAYEDTQHPITMQRIDEIHEFSKKVALTIWEQNPEGESISDAESKRIANCIVDTESDDKEMKRDLLIGQFFECRIAEGKNSYELRFVHRTIYEYYVALAIFEEIKDVVKSDTSNNWNYLKDDPLDDLSTIICYRQIIDYPNIEKYLRFLLRSIVNNYKATLWTKIMDGCITCGEVIGNDCPSSIRCSIVNFVNMVWIVKTSLQIGGANSPIQLWSDNKKVEELIRTAGSLRLRQDLSSLDLQNMDLGFTFFEHASFRNTNLTNTSFTNSYLKSADFSDAICSLTTFSQSQLDNIICSKQDIQRWKKSK